MVLNEFELFSYLKEFHYPDLEKSQSKFANFDCLSKDQKLYIELKSRNTHYDDLIIEKIKYDAIIKAAVESELYPLYINSTPEGIWSFDLFSMGNLKWEDRWLPAKTEFPNGGNKTKIVGYLHIRDGKKL